MQNAECRMRNPASGSTSHVSRVTHHASRITFHVSRSQRAFTMVEIAISLAIIGFALVAIIGVLPIGMTVQKDNREETIINQDATVFVNAIRNGARGLDDLTNYVTMITEEVWTWVSPTKPPQLVSSNWFNYANSSLGEQFRLTSGYRIVGLLSTPKYVPLISPRGVSLGLNSNRVVAYVRSISGAASEKTPTNYLTISGLANSFSFSYRLTSEVIPYGTNYYDPSWVAFLQPGLVPSEFVTRSNAWMVTSNLQNNLHDLRLTFAWPFTPQGVVPKTARGQSFRTLVSGQLTNDPPGSPWFFLLPRTYVN
jgi:type II secretory pathway pseudopilin PulG